jgi:deoxyribose-phosphate aldolase
MRSRTVDRVMVEARAASFQARSIKASSKDRALRLALSMLDLTTLEGKDTPEKVRALCRKAVRPGDAFFAAARERAASPSNPGSAGHDESASLHDREAAGGGARDHPALPSVAAVCVYPTFVRLAKEELAAAGGSHVKVASVATGFPSGQYPLDVRLDDVRRAVEDGADEIDMVINRGAFLAGRYGEVADEIRLVHAACRRDDGSHARLKVILETGELETYDNVRRAADLAIEAMAGRGGDCRGGFIKTSTGKVQPAATLPVTLIMLEAIRDHYLATGHKVGMKPAGGIATAKLAIQYLVMVKETLGDGWLTPEWFRFGASSLANDILRQIRWLSTGVYSARYDFSEA